MDKCQRCKSKPASLTCLDCESFQSLCPQCDSYLHTLPTKKNHKRLPNDSLQQRAEQLNNNNNINNINLSLNHNNNPEDDIISSCKPQLNLTHPSFQPNQPCDNSSSSVTVDTKFFYSNHYSKDYLNEIKSIYQKEKHELEYKNSTLQTNLDRLKLSFAEQMNSLNSQLEELQNKNIITIKAIQDNSDRQIDEVINSKNAEIAALNQRLKASENDKEMMLNQMKKDNIASNKKMMEMNDKIMELELILQRKDDELLKLKYSFDTMMTQNENLLQEQRMKVVTEYEGKMESILNDVESSREKLTKMIEEREVDIKSIIENNRNEVNDFNIVIGKLQKEVECHKANIIKLRDERDYLKEQNGIMCNKESGYICNDQSKDLEIRRLMDDNGRLLNENDELKIQLSKLDKLIYGKIRPNNFR